MDIEITSPAPVLNTPNFTYAFGGDDGTKIPRDAYGHPLHYEFVALTGMRFSVIQKVSPLILQIQSDLYPSGRLFIDERFTRKAHKQCQKHRFPSRNTLALRMKKLLGTKYVWGGNWSSGIPQLLQYYPPKGPLDEHTRSLWEMKGVDCSGLLFETTNGLTPRNTKDLINFGCSLPIQGKPPKELLPLLVPMDMVVWPGHVWFVLDQEHSIESKSPFGVIRRPLLERLKETCAERSGVNEWNLNNPQNQSFVIRRITKA